MTPDSVIVVPDFLADMYHAPTGWEEFTPEVGYRKKPCMIRLKSDGVEHGPCWPNAGRFVALHAQTGRGEWMEHEVTAVAYFRPIEEP